MPANLKDFEAFSSEYHQEEKEILLLTPDKSGGAAKFYDSWRAIQYFLAYVDLDSNELKNGDGRLNWLISEEEIEKHSSSFTFNFKNGTIYRLKVRELKDKTVPEGRIASAYNNFMVVKIMEEDVQNDELQAILSEYRKPIKITDKILGEFELNKDYSSFQGTIHWINQDITVALDVDTEEKETWTQAMNILRELYSEKEKRDLEFRTFAGEQLTALANDWLEEENKEISKSDFIKRLSLSELVADFNGGYTLYYNDDDMFYGHAIEVSGNTKTGIESANIVG